MQTITKKDLIDRIAESTGQRRVAVKQTVQAFLDAVIDELGNGNRLEFRDFGVFESKLRKPRQAQNPKTLEPVPVPAKQTVKFKPGRLMKQVLDEGLPKRLADEGLSEQGVEIVTRPLRPAERVETQPTE
ncbi:MAG: HU family DNA-binding protein [Phycisphaerales bacterium JB038]